MFFFNGAVAKVAITRTRLVVEEVCCTSASQHYCILFFSMTCSFFTQAHFTLVLHQWVQCASSMRSSASDDDEEGHNTWNAFLDRFVRALRVA